MSAQVGGARVRLALTLAGLVASTALAAAPLDVVRECAAAASPGVSGLKNLSAVCPQLDAALTALKLNEILYEGWQDKVSAHALQDAAVLAERYSGSMQQRSLDQGVLRGILGSYKSQQERPDSWWHALQDWFKRWLAHSNSTLANWLNQFWDRWLSHAEVSPGFLKVFMYGLTALVLSAAIVVIIRELNAAGMARRLGTAARARGARRGGSQPAFDGEAASAVGSVAELLQALVQRLLQSGRLKAERSLTHRELIARSAFDNESQRVVFAGVAHTAESLLYGSQSAAPEVLEQVTRQGRALLLQLSNSTGAP